MDIDETYNEIDERESRRLNREQIRAADLMNQEPQEAGHGGSAGITTSDLSDGATCSPNYSPEDVQMQENSSASQTSHIQDGIPAQVPQLSNDGPQCFHLSPGANRPSQAGSGNVPALSLDPSFGLPPPPANSPSLR